MCMRRRCGLWSWSEPPVFQQVWGRRIIVGGEGETQIGAEPAAAVEAATELLHEDYAYEFQIGWSLWEVESFRGDAGPSTSSATAHPTDEDLSLGTPMAESAQGDNRISTSGTMAPLAPNDKQIGRWVRGPRLVHCDWLWPFV